MYNIFCNILHIELNDVTVIIKIDQLVKKKKNQ